MSRGILIEQNLIANQNFRFEPNKIWSKKEHKPVKRIRICISEEHGSLRIGAAQEHGSLKIEAGLAKFKIVTFELRW